MVYRGALTAGYIKERKYSSAEKARNELIKIQRLILDFSQRKKERALKNRGTVTGFIAPSLTSL
jgi:hypothetical protein